MGPPPDRGEGWFTATYAAHYPHVVRYGLRRLADLDAAVELAQEVFVVAWRRRAQVPDHSLPWLYGVARRLLANEWRARRTSPEAVPVADPDQLRTRTAEGAGAVDSADASTELAAVRTALDSLREPDREILRLVGWEELTVSEAATVLGCTRTTAAVRLHRARRRLQEAMKAAMKSPAPKQLVKES